jgi:hypothetical protein
LVEPAVEPRQRFGDTIRRLFVLTARGGTLVAVWRHTFELPRQIVEPLVDGREVVANRLLVVLVVALWSASVPHVYSIAEIMTPPAAPGRRRACERKVANGAVRCPATDIWPIR